MTAQSQRFSVAPSVTRSRLCGFRHRRRRRGSISSRSRCRVKGSVMLLADPVGEETPEGHPLHVRPVTRPQMASLLADDRAARRALPHPASARGRRRQRRQRVDRVHHRRSADRTGRCRAAPSALGVRALRRRAARAAVVRCVDPEAAAEAAAQDSFGPDAPRAEAAEHAAGLPGSGQQGPSGQRAGRSRDRRQVQDRIGDR